VESEESMVSQKTKDSINGWGPILRFITPILLALVMFILNGLKDEIKDIRETVKDLTVSSLVYNTNHLTHHASIERKICERLATIESLIKK
jgi:hypothetical protein